MSLSPAGQARRAGVRQAREQAGLPAAEEAAAGAAEPPGPAAAGRAALARALEVVLSSPCESEAPMRAQAQLPANPCRRVTRPRARRARSAWMCLSPRGPKARSPRVGQVAPAAPGAPGARGALGGWTASRTLRAPARAARMQPEEQVGPARAPWVPAQVQPARARQARPPTALGQQPVARVARAARAAQAVAPAQRSLASPRVGCSWPAAPCDGRQVRYPIRPCRKATTPASPAPSGVRRATRRALEARA